MAPSPPRIGSASSTWGRSPTQEKINLLHLAEVLVLPSRFEAFGIVFLEAWACGTPVIGAATGAIPSVVGEGGLTFPYGDANATCGEAADHAAR